MTSSPCECLTSGQHYQDQAKHAVAKGLGHVDYLHMLISGEAQQRAQRATQRRIRNAHFPYIRTLDTYNFSHPHKNRPDAGTKLISLSVPSQ